jgi:hypothetical protein
VDSLWGFKTQGIVENIIFDLSPVLEFNFHFDGASNKNWIFTLSNQQERRILNSYWFFVSEYIVRQCVGDMLYIPLCQFYVSGYPEEQSPPEYLLHHSTFVLWQLLPLLLVSVTEFKGNGLPEISPLILFYLLILPGQKLFFI